MADNTQRNEEIHLEETTHRPGKEPQRSQRTNATETPCSERNNGDFNPTGEQIPKRQSEDAYDPTRYVPLVELENRQLRQCLVESNWRNIELEQETATTRVAQGINP
uniref:Uncharacterized protein n=1 Tax=Cannabis sativa TaxID=3483 RepID=A0A803QS74_CANSA